MSERAELLPGTLDMLILKTLTRAPLHGYGIALSIKRFSDDVLTVEEGSLYPALHRMEQDGWVRSEWGATEKGRKAKFYSLTPKGEEQLVVERESWERLTKGVSRALRYA